MLLKKTSYDKGIIAEEKAVNYLQNNNFKILENRYKTNYGEIDVLEKGIC